jgi:hypothetical protein
LVDFGFELLKLLIDNDQVIVAFELDGSDLLFVLILQCDVLRLFLEELLLEFVSLFLNDLEAFLGLLTEGFIL